MQIEQSYFRDVAVLVVRGELDYFQAAPLFKEIEKQKDLGYTKVILDLKRVPFLNSTALGSIVKGKNELEKAGGRLAIAEPNGMVREILQVTKLAGRIGVYPNIVDALKALLEKPEEVKASATAETSEPIEVTTTEGVLVFRFADEFKAGRFGKRNAVGCLENLGTEELTFAWPKAASADPSAAPPDFAPSEVFAKGTVLHLTFALHSFRKDFYFKIESAVSACEAREDRRLRVRVKFKDLTKEQRGLIEQYLADQKLIHDETGQR